MSREQATSVEVKDETDMKEELPQQEQQDVARVEHGGPTAQESQSKAAEKHKAVLDSQTYKIELDHKVEHEGVVYRGVVQGSEELCKVLLEKQQELVDQKENN